MSLANYIRMDWVVVVALMTVKRKGCYLKE